MQKTILLILFVLLIVPLASATLTNNTILYYSMDNEDMSSFPSSDSFDIYDLSSNGYDGYTRNFNNAQEGIRREGVNTVLEGASTFGRIEINNNTYNSNLSGSSSFGVSLWYKPSDTAETRPHVLLSNSDGGTNRIALFYRGGLFRATVYDGSFYFGNASSFKNTSEWYHVVMNSDGSSDAVVYVNGIANTVTDVSQHNSGTACFVLGNSFDGASFNDKINGSLEEVFIRAEPFTNAEIEQLYNNGLGLNPFKEKLYGVDHNKTYYKNQISYFYQFNNISNEGYENENTSSLTNQTSCKSNYCFNGSIIIDKENTTLNELNSFSGMFWFKGNISDGGVTRPNAYQLRHTYQTGASILEQYLSYGLNNAGEIWFTSDSGGVNINTGIKTGYDTFQHLAFSYDGSNLILYHNATLISNTTESISFSTGVDSNVSDFLLDSNNRLLDDAVLFDFAITQEDVEQNIYYTENNIELTLYPVLPPVNLSIYAVCNETITLTTNITEQRTFNWSDAEDLQYLTITYGVRVGSLYLINETFDTSFDYNFTTPPFINGIYTSEVEACNPYECASDSCTFDICISNWEAINAQCIDELELLIYNDTNDCPISYNVPVDNGTLSPCEPELGTIEKQKSDIRYFLIFIMLFILTVLAYFTRLPTYVGVIFSVITMIYGFMTFNYYYEPVYQLIIGISTLLFIGLAVHGYRTNNN